MAVLTAQGISSVNIELLLRMLVLPNTVTRVPGAEFAGHNGDTITVRVPQPGAARTQASKGATLTADDVDEIAVDVTLAHLYHLKNISDQELSLELEDFARQIGRVQVGAVAEGAEDEIYTAMNDLAADDSFALTATEDDTDAQLLAAREFLSDSKAPTTDRYFACSPDIYTRVLSVDKFVRADASGSPAFLTNASPKRIYGMWVFEASGLDAGTAVAYHKSGFVFANRVPVAPRGATDTATAAAGGVGLRQIFQYDASTAQDQSLVSTFGGAAAVWEDGATASDNKRFYKLDTAVS